MFLILGNLDDQFDVGDMVEISGQTGVVTELGLRTARLRNYLGQTVASSLCSRPSSSLRCLVTKTIYIDGF